MEEEGREKEKEVDEAEKKSDDGAEEDSTDASFTCLCALFGEEERPPGRRVGEEEGGLGLGCW